MEWLVLRGGEVLWAISFVAAAAIAGLFVHFGVFAVATRLTSRTPSVIDDSVRRRAKGPSRLLFPLLAVLLALPMVGLPERSFPVVRHGLGLILIAGVAWLLVNLTRTAADVVASRFPLDVENNLHARQVTTQVRVLRRVAALLIALVALGLMLMSFPDIRELGTSLLASAGLAGIVAGMAARPALSNLVAGIQLALTQPIRIDDVVVVEGEWGRIEEIRPTFVVVRIWDLRRLIVPLSYFIEHPVENWTRESSDLLGTVLVYADYRVPVQSVRDELREILESSGMWDGKAWGLQVTDASAKAVELRAMMSAPNASTAWDLRCHVRERLIRYLRERYPETLPRVRAEIESGASESENPATR